MSASSIAWEQDRQGALNSATVDILLATHNGEKYLDEQIRSIIEQTWSDWRLLISDDQSSDTTREIVNRWIECDSRITLVSVEKKGSAVRNFMSLLPHAEADLVMFCDQDDVWMPDKIAKSVRASTRAGDAENPLLVCSDVHVVDRDLKLLSQSFIRSSALRTEGFSLSRTLTQNPALGCTILINKSLLEIVRQKPADMDRVIMHDWWLSIAACAFGSIVYLDEPLMWYRQHGGNDVGAKTYSVRYLLRIAAEGRRRTYAILDQAVHFREVFAFSLPPNSRAVLDGMIGSFTSGRFSQLKTLVRGGYLKKGALRAFGQVVFALAAPRIAAAHQETPVAKRARG